MNTTCFNNQQTLRSLLKRRCICPPILTLTPGGSVSSADWIVCFFLISGFHGLTPDGAPRLENLSETEMKKSRKNKKQLTLEDNIIAFICNNCTHLQCVATHSLLQYSLSQSWLSTAGLLQPPLTHTLVMAASCKIVSYEHHHYMISSQFTFLLQC